MIPALAIAIGTLPENDSTFGLWFATFHNAFLAIPQHPPGRELVPFIGQLNGAPRPYAKISDRGSRL